MPLPYLIHFIRFPRKLKHFIYGVLINQGLNLLVNIIGINMKNIQIILFFPLVSVIVAVRHSRFVAFGSRQLCKYAKMATGIPLRLPFNFYRQKEKFHKRGGASFRKFVTSQFFRPLFCSPSTYTGLRMNY